MLFKDLVITLEELEKISSTNAMQSTLAKLFKKCSAKQIRSVIYLVLGEIDAEVKGVETGLASKMVMRSIALASGAKLENVRKDYKKKGDLGLVAEHYMQGKHPCTFKKYLKTRKTR